MAVKELVFQMHDLINQMIEGTDSLYAAFINNTVRFLDEAEGAVGGIAEKAEALTGAIVQEARGDPAAIPYVSVPSHIERMGGDMGRMFGALRKKITGDILFSDKASGELEYLLERTRDILVNCGDMVLARNVLVARHIVESESVMQQMADKYATQHEERLIEGLCLPGASVVYLELLDSIKGIAWHAKEIAKDLGR